MGGDATGPVPALWAWPGLNLGSTTAGPCKAGRRAVSLWPRLSAPVSRLAVSAGRLAASFDLAPGRGPSPMEVLVFYGRDPRGNNWRRVSAKNPCPICGNDRYCSLSSDGTLAKCMSKAEGRVQDKERQDRHGIPLAPPRRHRPAAASPAAPGVRPHRGTGRRRPASRRLLGAAARLPPHPTAHRANLRQRGLADDEIDRRGYRTLPVQGRRRAGPRLREQFGDKLLSVPGFVVKQGETRPLRHASPAPPGSWFPSATWPAASSR